VKRLLCALALALPALAQESGTPVQVVAFPSAQPDRILDYSGTSLIYVGVSSPVIDYTRIVGTSAYRWTRAASTLTSVVVLTNVGTVTTSTAHGLTVGQKVVITGATVDTDLNATYRVVSVTSTTVFTIATVNVGNATYTDAGMVLSTNAPLTTQPIWAIKFLTYDGSSNLIGVKCSFGACKSYTAIWDNRAVTSGSTLTWYQ